MLESTFQRKFSHWLQAKWAETSAFELKVCKTDRFNLKYIREHQIRALKIAESELLYYKIPDVGRAQKPFDCFTLYQEEVYVVILFTKTKNFYVIETKYIVRFIEQGKKSINEEECFSVCYWFDKLK